jgi:hypothetical protein
MASVTREEMLEYLPLPFDGLGREQEEAEARDQWSRLRAAYELANTR